MADLSINKVYSFDTLAPIKLGQEYKNIRLATIMDYETACKHTNVSELHAIVYPIIKDKHISLDNDPTTYTYLGFDTGADTIYVLAKEWINMNTLVEENKTTTTIVIRNTSTEEVMLLQTTLGRLGFTDFELSQS